MLQKHGSKGKYTRLLNLKIYLTIKRHPCLPHIQMAFKQAPANRHIPFLWIMVFLVFLNPLGVHNKCMVLKPNWKFHALGV